MKFVDMSQDPPVEVSVNTLRDCAFQVARLVGVQSYGVSRQFDEWMLNPEIDTPKPDFELSGEKYWRPDRLEEWKTLYEKEIDKVEARKSDTLDRRTMSHNQLLDALIEHSKEVVRLNGRAYSHNRGNSLRDGRQRTVELIGVKGFVMGIIGGDGSVPKDKVTELNSLISQAKSHVKIQ